MLFASAAVQTSWFCRRSRHQLATVPVESMLNNTLILWWGHFHYVIYGAGHHGRLVCRDLSLGSLNVTGKMYYEGLGQLHFLLTFSRPT